MATLYLLQQAVHQSVKRRRTCQNTMEIIHRDTRGGGRGPRPRSRGESLALLGSVIRETRSSVIHDRRRRSTARTDSRLDYHTRDIMLALADRSPLALNQTAERIDGVLVARPLPRLPSPSAITANMVRGLKIPCGTRLSIWLA